MERKIFSDRIIELRKEAGLSQTALAKIIGADRYTIDNIERGQNLRNHDYTILLADYFDVSLDYLYGRTNNRKGIFFNSGEEAATLEKVAI